MTFDTIVFAIIAIVIFLKLKKEFGKISDDDDIREKIINSLKQESGETTQKGKIIDITNIVKKKGEEKKPNLIDLNIKYLNKTLRDKLLKSSKTKSILQKINLDNFLKGSENAIEVITKAFSKKDIKILNTLLSKNMYTEFKKKLDSCNKKQQTIQSSIISVLKKEIVDFQVKNRYIYIDVRFETEQINFIEDKDGNIVNGDKNKIEKIKEVWSFKREVESKDLNWKITGIMDVH